MFHYFQVFKKICLGEEFHDLIKKICCLTVPKNFVEELLCFTIFLVSKNFMDKRGGGKEGGVSRHSVKIFVSHSTDNLRR